MFITQMIHLNKMGNTINFSSEATSHSQRLLMDCVQMNEPNCLSQSLSNLMELTVVSIWPPR